MEIFLQRLQVRLTDDEDPFFFYSLVLTESDFQVLYTNTTQYTAVLHRTLRSFIPTYLENLCLM